MGVNFLMENYVPFLSKLKICLYFVIVKIYVYEIIENLGINKSIKGSLKHFRKKSFQYGFETGQYPLD